MTWGWSKARVRAMAWVRAMARVRVNVRVRVIAIAIFKARVRAMACVRGISTVWARAKARDRGWAKEWVEIGRGCRLSPWRGRMPGLGLWLVLGMMVRACVRDLACVRANSRATARIRSHGMGAV